MSLKHKKERLINILKQSFFSEKAIMEFLIKGNSLNQVIAHRVKIHEEIPFLTKLNFFLSYFNETFNNVRVVKKNILETILSEPMVLDFFDYEVSLEDSNTDLFMQQIILYNFSNNISVLGKYFSDILNENSIDYTNVSIDTLKDTTPLLSLLIDLVEYNPNICVFFLFDNIKKAEKRKFDLYSSYPLNWSDINIRYVKSQWEQIFDNYKQNSK